MTDERLSGGGGATGERIAYTVTAPAPDAADTAVAARQRRVLDRAVGTLQELLDTFPPDDLETFSDIIGRTLRTPTGSAAQSEAVSALTRSKVYSKQERVALETSAHIRSFRHRHDLLVGSLTATQVAELLGTSRQTPHDRVKAGTLLAVPDHGVLRFPPWQFDPQGPHGVIDGLPATIRALRVSSFAKVSWLVRPNPYLDGLAPVDALKEGKIEEVVGLAAAVGMS